MKKSLAMILAPGTTMVGLVGCGGGTFETVASDTATVQTTTAGTTAADTMVVQTETSVTGIEGPITVVSREDGSGTRSAFIELLSVGVKNNAGEKEDMATEDVEITSNASAMMMTVAGNTETTGYISLGSLNDTMKAVKIDGVEATVDNVKPGSYKIVKPFSIATKEDMSEVTMDFIKYMMGGEGQKIVEDNGYINQGNEGAYEIASVSDKIVMADSPSVAPAMEKLKKIYVVLNPDVTIEVQQSDSTIDVTSAVEGMCDIDMASRELKDTELEKGVRGTVIAIDSITVIVDNDSPIEELGSETIKGIYTGGITDWADAQQLIEVTCG